jgi:ABC-2 type transport system permease protein
MMSVAREDAKLRRLLLFDDAPPVVGRLYSENSPRLLVSHTWVQTERIVRGWARDATTVLESLILPVALLFTLNLVLGKGISQVTGHSALYGSVPMVAMVGTMAGSTVGGIGLMRERGDGLLARFWVLPVHRASGLLSRLAAEAVRILVTTVVILCAGLLLGFRLQQGFFESLTWLFVPTIFGVAFSILVTTLALYSAKTTLVEATAIVYALLMFFSTGYVPVDSYPRWVQPAVQHQPMTYAIEAMRGLSLGGPVLSPMIGMLLWSGAIAAACVIPMAFGYRRASMRA